MSFRRSRLLALSLGLFATSIARPEVLRLANGDLIQGQLLAHKDGTIRWAHPQLGLLSIPETAATVVPDQPPEATGPEIALDPTPPTTQAAPAATAVAEPKDKAPAAKERWQSIAESGLSLHSGRNNSTNVHLRFESTFKRRNNDFRLQSLYAYSKANGTVSQDRTEGSFRWRRKLDALWFAQAQASYLSAKLKGLDHNIEQDLGVGYRLIQTERTTLSLGTGLTWQYREIVDGGTGNSLFGKVFQDFAFKISPRLELGEELTANYSPSSRGIRVLSSGAVQHIDTDVTNYTVALKTFLRGKITETFSLALRYEYEFDNTYVDGSTKADQRITTSLGYTF